ncbi:nucleolar complex protein 3 homolog isoform X2 [Microcaecilia unicolor]|uniref:Nucleolar complex protein 3 homolog n=1 Tax=Microcaecilia unicolor TaxID=1415580 RepID=A0A6P7Y251_9AMPH|nr:nucleolar complex protein 3 homolog isoform X2 [Microcaecilia unicolor]
MKQRRNTKKVPSFRKLLKTSRLKLENKLKNKQFKQQSSAKKHRKEQKQIREALRDAKARIPVPLEKYKKKQPVEEDEEEMEEESLPLDMLEEDDLHLMKEMAQRASFVTRVLSSSEPIHARKRKQDSVIEKYEKMPRRLQMEPEKEVIHLLPIKDKRGIIPQSMEKPVLSAEENEGETDEEEAESEQAPVASVEDPLSILSTEELLLRRKEMLRDRKVRIAALASAILSEPENSVKKETQKLREFEEGLVSQYKFFLENLEQAVRDWKKMKVKKSEVIPLKAYKGLAEVAVKSLCDLLVSLPHFNFHNNIVIMLVPLMNDSSLVVSEMCCEAVKKLFKQDKLGHSSLCAVKVISGLVKSRNYNVRPEVLKVLLHLRIKEVEVKKDTEDITVKKTFMTFKEKRKNLSRMQRKWKKAEEKLERELLEAEATESKEKKLKLHTETLNIVFLTYFRILKRAQKSPLLPAVLEGLAKFAHLINIEFFDDLLVVLHSLVTSDDLSYRESLHCIQTAFNILSGQGDVLNIDPLKFYNHLYKILFGLHAGATNDDIAIVLECLDLMLMKRRKQVSQQRALAFLKRLSTLALHVLPDSSVGILSTIRSLMQAFPKTDILLDNDCQGSGLYLPELDEPEYCNAQNTALWELRTLQKHYHPVVRRFASHLCAGAPAEGSEALRPELGRRSPMELFEEYSMKGMNFNPPVASSVPRKKGVVLKSDSFLNEDLNKMIQLNLGEAAGSGHLDFAKCLIAQSLG